MKHTEIILKTKLHLGEYKLLSQKRSKLQVLKGDLFAAKSIDEPDT